MKYRLFQIIIFLSFIFLSACHKDSDTSTSEVTNVFAPLVLKEISGNILGYVYDEKNKPVVDATVSIYSSSAKTNKFGVFTFENTKMDQQGTYIRVSKNGYFHASDFVYPADKSTTYSYTKILKLDNGALLDSKTGGSVNVSGAAKLIFPSDAIIDNKGNVYTGNVNVFARYLDPNDRELSNVMPGGLMADASNGNTVLLGTLGMVGVELRDNNGNLLNLKQGKKAVIEFPVNTTYKPSEIPLWSFDELKGRWKEEGKAVLSGNKYIGEVSHFSFWNIDAPFPLIDICGKVVYEDGSPASNITIKVETEGLGTSYGVTNSIGEFCGKMPKGKKLKIKIYHTACKNDITEINVGPFDIKTILDNIVAKSITSFKIKGKISCNNTAVANGVAVIKIKETSLMIKAAADGSFAADLTQFLCGDNVPVNIFAFDNNTSETSQGVSVTPANAQNLILNVCTVVCDLKADMIYDCDKTLTANISSGSGNYSYKWDNNSAGKSLILPNQDSMYDSKTYCVTVRDLTGNCEKVFCKQVGGKIVVGLETDCEKGILYAFYRGGFQPVAYKWTDGSTNKEFKSSSPGKYCVTVTDATGCTDSKCADISNTLTLSGSPSSCSKNIYNIFSSPFLSGQITGSGLGNNNQLTFPIAIDVFKTGFNLGILLKDSQCSTLKQIKLPQLVQGLTTTFVNTTCGTCTDGKINFLVSNTAQCVDCKTGAVKIFRIDDMANDLSAANSAGTLSKGDYYVVVTDANNGCYIAFNKVKIQ